MQKAIQTIINTTERLTHESVEMALRELGSDRNIFRKLIKEHCSMCAPNNPKVSEFINDVVHFILEYIREESYEVADFFTDDLLEFCLIYTELYCRNSASIEAKIIVTRLCLFMERFVIPSISVLSGYSPKLDTPAKEIAKGLVSKLNELESKIADHEFSDFSSIDTVKGNLTDTEMSRVLQYIFHPANRCTVKNIKSAIRLCLRNPVEFIRAMLEKCFTGLSLWDPSISELTDFLFLSNMNENSRIRPPYLAEQPEMFDWGVAGFLGFFSEIYCRHLLPDEREKERRIRYLFVTFSDLAESPFPNKTPIDDVQVNQAMGHIHDYLQALEGYYVISDYFHIGIAPYGEGWARQFLWFIKPNDHQKVNHEAVPSIQENTA